MAGTEKAWLLLAVTGQRQHGGNDGYLDQPDAFYSWDSTVSNHAGPRVGHRVAIWDKTTLLGCSVVQGIDTGTASKQLSSCPTCGRASIKRRTSLTPEYRCQKCGSEFDTPTQRTRDVVTYRARHDIAWTDMAGAIDASTLRSLAVKPDSQLSLRPLDWNRFKIAAGLDTEPAAIRALSSFLTAAPSVDPAQGHRIVLVRARRGQAAFRRRLLDGYGPNCALTGPAPLEALEAAHLYSYATVGRHHDHGGLLLRRDIHSLFDAGRITVDERRRIALHPGLLPYRQYTGLSGTPIRIDPTAQQLTWLAAHHRAHHRANTPIHPMVTPDGSPT